MYTNNTYELDAKKLDEVTGGSLAHLAFQDDEEINVIGKKSPEKETPLGNQAHPGFGKPDSNRPNLPVSGPIPPIPQSRGGRLG